MSLSARCRAHVPNSALRTARAGRKDLSLLSANARLSVIIQISCLGCGRVARGRPAAGVVCRRAGISQRDSRDASGPPVPTEPCPPAVSTRSPICGPSSASPPLSMPPSQQQPTQPPSVTAGAAQRSRRVQNGSCRRSRFKPACIVVHHVDAVIAISQCRRRPICTPDVVLWRRGFAMPGDRRPGWSVVACLMHFGGTTGVRTVVTGRRRHSERHEALSAHGALPCTAFCTTSLRLSFNLFR